MKTRTSPHWKVTREEEGQRLDRFLAVPERLGSRGRVRVALDRGQVFVNDREAPSSEAGSRVAEGDLVRWWADRPGSARRRAGFDAGPLRIVYEDETLLVVNKPAGLLAVPLGRRKDASSAYSYVADHLASSRRTPFIVHRIDRDTSGLVVFAKSARAQEALKNQFSKREPERVYWAIVRGRPRPVEGTWRDRLVWDSHALVQKPAHEKSTEGAEAISEYRVLETFADASLVEVRLRTGKRNQIRIQAAMRGHPLIGEKQYLDGPSEGGPSKRTGPTGEVFSRQALHAHRLAFRHPTDGRQLAFEAPLPEDLTALLTQLRKGVRR